MRWQITHFEYPDGDPDRIILDNIEDIWTELEWVNELVVDDDGEFTRLWEGSDPVAWMKLYNEVVEVPGEFFQVWDLETDKQLL